MEVVIIALAGFLIIGTVWSLVSDHESSHATMRHDRLLRELSRHD